MLPNIVSDFSNMHVYFIWYSEVINNMTIFELLRHEEIAGNILNIYTQLFQKKPNHIHKHIHKTKLFSRFSFIFVVENKTLLSVYWSSVCFYFYHTHFSQKLFHLLTRSWIGWNYELWTCGELYYCKLLNHTQRATHFFSPNVASHVSFSIAILLK